MIPKLKTVKCKVWDSIDIKKRTAEVIGIMPNGKILAIRQNHDHLLKTGYMDNVQVWDYAEEMEEKQNDPNQNDNKDKR